MTDYDVGGHREMLPDCIRHMAEVKAVLAEIRSDVLETRENVGDIYGRTGQHDIDLRVHAEFIDAMKQQLPPALDKISRANGAIPHIQEDIRKLSAKMDEISKTVFKAMGGIMVLVAVGTFIAPGIGPLLEVIKKMVFGGG